jgi:hypothetical protein
LFSKTTLERFQEIPVTPTFIKTLPITALNSKTWKEKPANLMIPIDPWGEGVYLRT